MGAEPALWLDRVDTAPVDMVPVDPVSAVVSAGPEGRYDVVLTVPARVRELRLGIEGADVSDVQIQGRAVAPSNGEDMVRIRWASPGSEMRLSLTAPAGAHLRWAAFSDGWPQGAPRLTRRPADLAPWGASDSVVVVGEAALRPPG